MRFSSCCILPTLALTLLSVSVRAENPDRYLDKTVKEAIRSLGQPAGRMSVGSTELLTFDQLELTAENGIITSSKRLKPLPVVKPAPSSARSGQKPEPVPEPEETETASDEVVEEEIDLGPAPVLSSRQRRRMARRTSGAISTNNPALLLPRMESDREPPSVLQSTTFQTGAAGAPENRRQYERPVLEVDRDKPSVLQQTP